MPNFSFKMLVLHLSSVYEGKQRHQHTVRFLIGSHQSEHPYLIPHASLTRPFFFF